MWYSIVSLWRDGERMSEDNIQPPDKSKETADKNQQPINEPPVIPLNVGKVEPKRDPNTPGANHKKRKRKPLSCAEIWAVALGIVAILVAAGTGVAIIRQDVIANRTLSEIQKQYPKLAESADAASRSADTVKSQWLNDQRPLVLAPIVKPSSLMVGQRPMMNVYFANYGKDPALKASGKAAIFTGKKALKQADAWFKVEDKKANLGPPTAIIPPGIPQSEKDGSVTSNGIMTTVVAKESLSQDDFNFATTKDDGVVVVMREQYFDSLGNRYWTDQCWTKLKTGAVAQCPQGHNEVH